MRQQNETDDDASHQITHNDLQEGEVCIVGKARDTDDRQGTGLGRDDGERDCPPGDVSIGQEIITHRSLTLAESQTE